MNKSVKNQIVAAGDMSADIAGTWICLGDGFNSPDKFTLSCHAASVAGTKDGTLSLYVSNDLKTTTPKGGSTAKATLTINAENWDGVFEVGYPYKYFKVDYAHNSISGGTLNIFFAGI